MNLFDELLEYELASVEPVTDEWGRETPGNPVWESFNCAAWYTEPQPAPQTMNRPDVIITVLKVFSSDDRLAPGVLLRNPARPNSVWKIMQEAQQWGPGPVHLNDLRVWTAEKVEN